MSKPKPRLNILLHGVEESPSPRCEPGSALTGTVELFMAAAANCRALTVGIRWRLQTSREQDDTHSQSLERITLHRGGVLGSGTSTYPFSLPVPREPWSYQGQIIRIEWEIVAELALSPIRAVAESVNFLLAPRGWR